MERSWYWRLIIVLALIAWGVYQAMPTFIYLSSDADVRRSRAQLKERIPDWLPESRMNLGIDLQGGLHLVMGVDTERAVLNRVDRVGDELAQQMEESGKPLKSVMRQEDEPTLEIELASPDDYEALKEHLEARGDTWTVRSHSGSKVVWTMRTEFVKQLEDDAVAQSIKTLRNRIDQYGVTEPEVRKSGDNSVLIQIAGLTADQEQSVKDDIIGKTAQLEFKMVDDESKYFAEIGATAPEGISLQMDSYQTPSDTVVTAPYLSGKSKEDLEAFVRANPPPADRVVGYERMPDNSWRTYLMFRKTPLTGDSIVSAFESYNSDELNYFVSLKLDRAGATIFDQLTAANVGKRMAIVLDDVVDSTPVIQDRIGGGNVSITLGGGRTQQEQLDEAKALATVLNAGALPAPVYPQEERTVGSTLGDDAVAKGKWAMLSSALLTMLVMLIYYRLAGGISVIALGTNILLLFSVLAMFNATLTLPGLAGLALTIGMAVDANIVQFERIREELRLGKTVRAAVDAGFDKAFSAIFDANVTTFLAAIVLYQYGSGPIRGFATTLGVGVVLNTFVAVIVPRLFLEYFARARRVQTLSI